MKITHKLLTHLTRRNPTQLQTLWETETEAGREYAKYAAKAAKFKNEPRADVFTLRTELEKKGYRLTGTTETEHIISYHYVTDADEIEIQIHRNKGDLYGVFQKIKDTRPSAILTRLTEPDLALANVELSLNNWVRTLQNRYLEVGATIEADEIRLLQDSLRQLVSIIRDKI